MNAQDKMVRDSEIDCIEQVALSLLEDSKSAEGSNIEGSNIQPHQIELAAQALELVRRYEMLYPELIQLDAQRLPELGLELHQGITELTRQLRAGEVKVNAELTNYLKQRCLMQLAIDSPEYWGYRDARAQWASD